MSSKNKTIFYKYTSAAIPHANWSFNNAKVEKYSVMHLHENPLQ